MRPYLLCFSLSEWLLGQYIYIYNTLKNGTLGTFYVFLCTALCILLNFLCFLLLCLLNRVKYDRDAFRYLTCASVANWWSWSAMKIWDLLSGHFRYVHYSTIAARVLRKSLKSNLRVEASKRDVSQIKFLFWSEGLSLGKAVFFKYL